MEKFEPSCPWHIQIGGLFIAPGRVPNSGTVWVGEIDSGKGREIDVGLISHILRYVYDKES